MPGLKGPKRVCCTAQLKHRYMLNQEYDQKYHMYDIYFDISTYGFDKLALALDVKSPVYFGLRHWNSCAYKSLDYYPHWAWQCKPIV